jgi:hypothetical protein
MRGAVVGVVLQNRSALPSVEHREVSCHSCRWMPLDGREHFHGFPTIDEKM